MVKIVFFVCFLQCIHQNITETDVGLKSKKIQEKIKMN